MNTNNIELPEILKSYGMYIDRCGYTSTDLKDRIICTKSKPYPYNQPMSVGDAVFTQRTIGKQTSLGVNDYVLVSLYSKMDRVQMGGGSGEGRQVKCLYCHKDAIVDCPDFLPDDSVLEVIDLDTNEHGVFVKKAKIVWIRPVV